MQVRQNLDVERRENKYDSTYTNKINIKDFAPNAKRPEKSKGKKQKKKKRVKVVLSEDDWGDGCDSDKYEFKTVS